MLAQIKVSRLNLEHKMIKSQTHLHLFEVFPLHYLPILQITYHYLFVRWQVLYEAETTNQSKSMNVILPNKTIHITVEQKEGALSCDTNINRLDKGPDNWRAILGSGALY